MEGPTHHTNYLTIRIDSLELSTLSQGLNREKKMKFELIAAVALGVVLVCLVNSVRPQTNPPRTTTTKPPPVYYLPSGVELVVGDYRSTFRCEGRIYGYYADQDNNCQIFHICIPFVDEEGNDVPAMYSFFCGNQTVFDQSHLVCAHPADALPCEEAQSFYTIANENFGRTDRPFLLK